MKSAAANKTAGFISIFIIMCLAAALRICDLDKMSVWYDEAGTLLGSMNVGFIGLDADMPLGYMLSWLYLIFLKLWTYVSGDNEALIRMSSVLFGTCSVFVVYKISLAAFGRRAAVVAGFLFAISVFEIYYSRQIRPYAICLFFSLCAVYLYVSFLRNYKTSYLLGALLLNIIGVLLHYSSILIFAGQILFLSLNYKLLERALKKPKAYIISAVLVMVALSLPILPQIDSIAKNGPLLWLAGHRVGPANLIYTLKNFTLGYNILGPLAFIITVLAAALFFHSLFRHRSLLINLMALMAAAPVIFMFLLSFFINVYADRYIIFSAPYFIILVSVSIASLEGKYARAGIISLITFGSMVSLLNYYNHYLPGDFNKHIGIQADSDFKRAAGYLNNNYSESGLILNTCYNSISPLYYYSKGRIKEEEMNRLISVSESGKPDIYAFNMRGEDKRILNIDMGKYPTIWLIFSAWEFNGKNMPELNSVKWMDANYKRLERRGFTGLEIIKYKNGDIANQE